VEVMTAGASPPARSDRPAVEIGLKQAMGACTAASPDASPRSAAHETLVQLRIAAKRAALAVFFDGRPETGPASQGLVHSVHFRDSIRPALEAGVDYHLGKRWYMNAVIVQSFAPEQLDINGGAIIARTQLNLSGVGPGSAIGFEVHRRGVPSERLIR
jgi:hypothetical protein